MFPNCPLCRVESEFAFTARDYNLGSSPAKFDYFRCPQCRCFFLHPIPENPGKYYPSDYPAYEISDKDLNEITSPLEHEKLSITQRYVSKGRLLEVGPGSGGFARLANKRGFQVETIEMDERCSRNLNEKFGIPSIHGPDLLSTLPLMSSYDVIVLWHVIEHLAEPLTVLEQLAKHITPGGIIVFATPNPASVQFNFFGRHWVHLDAPRHMVLIPFSWLRNHGARLGLETVFFSTKDKLSRHLGSYAWYSASISNALKDSKSQRIGSIKNIFDRVHRILRYLIIFFPSIFIKGKGNAYTIILRKRSDP
jgi:SAM-dependent methyltransferase